MQSQPDGETQQMHTMQEFLTMQLGELPREVAAQATRWFEALLGNLNLLGTDPSHLRDPGDVGVRDRIVSYLEQLIPDLWESDLGPEVEKGLNALLIRTRTDVQTHAQVGTVWP